MSAEQPPAPPLRRVAVLLAGGVGVRVGLDIPKQLIKVAGRTLLEHTLIALHDHPDVDEVLVMMTPGHLDAVHNLIRDGRYPKVTGVLEGGETRNATTERALTYLGGRDGADAHVLFHDAVRPLITPRIITECFAALEQHPAVDVAIPSADTIVEVGQDDLITDIPPRAALRRGQTPQAFHLSVLADAYRIAGEDPDFTATDDCTVVLRYRPDAAIVVVPGDERNMKVTEPIDVYLADKLFQLTSSLAERDDTVRAEGLRGKTMVVFGGSYGIGADIAELAERAGADVFVFSRSATGTHVERRADIASAAAEVMAATGRVDFVVNTAGVLPRGELVQTSEETVYAATEINYIAPIFIAQEFYPLLARTQGALLLFTSSSYTRGRQGYSLYSSVKAATVNLTQALAEEWSESGVRVNCINPERTATPMRSKAFGEEPPESLLDSPTVARTSLDALLTAQSGHVFDVRKSDPLDSAVQGELGLP